MEGTFCDADSESFGWECWIEEIVNWVLMTKGIRGRGLNNVCHSVPNSGSFIEYRRRVKASAPVGTVAEDERRIVEKIFEESSDPADWIIGLTSGLAVSRASELWQNEALVANATA